MTKNTMLDTGTIPLGLPDGGLWTSASGTVSFSGGYTPILTPGSPGFSTFLDVGSAGTLGQYLMDNMSGTPSTWGSTPPPGRLLSFQFLTSGTGATYTPTSASVKTIIVEVIGGGGSAGGLVGSSTTYGATAGGNAGSYIMYPFPVAGNTFHYTIGAGGAAQTGANNGQTGGSTSFQNITGGVNVTANGGTGSTSAVGATLATGTITAMGATNGQTNYSNGITNGGSYGQFGFFSGVICTAGAGASNIYGGGGIGPSLTSTGTSAGNNATGYGAGGSGCCYYLDVTATSQTSGAGSPGIIIVWEYS